MQKKVAPWILPYNRNPSVRESPINNVFGNERAEGLVGLVVEMVASGLEMVVGRAVIVDRVVVEVLEGERVVTSATVVVKLVVCVWLVDVFSVATMSAVADVVVTVVVVVVVVVVGNVVVVVDMVVAVSGKYVCNKQPGTTTKQETINKIRKE